MSPSSAPPKGKKRLRNGIEKPNNASSSDQNRTPACAQPPKEPSTSSLATTSQSVTQNPQQLHSPRNVPAQVPRKKHHPNPPSQKKQKMARLPDNAKISKRPIPHPAIPTPFSSSSSPKTLYITPTSPFIPAVKRIRKLLSEISNRAAQSSSALSKLKPRGRLDPKDVERAIASESGAGKGKEGGVGGEEVFVKGTGRAIERALAIGVRFQREADCRVRVELGSVRAIDDIEAEADVEGEEDDGGGEAAERMDVDGGDEQQKKRKKKKRALRDEDIPETRIRSMSAVTVAISLR